MVSFNLYVKSIYFYLFLKCSFRYLFGEEVDGSAFGVFGVMHEDQKRSFPGSLQRVPVSKYLHTCPIAFFPLCFNLQRQSKAPISTLFYILVFFQCCYVVKETAF